jgi:hypothetical protein
LGRPFSISYAPVINRFGGHERAELQLIDWQPDPSVAPVAAAETVPF